MPGSLNRMRRRQRSRRPRLWRGVAPGASLGADGARASAEALDRARG